MSVIEKLLSKAAVQENGCWLFLGAWNKDGYGNVTYMGRTFSAHRLAYELLVNVIPRGISVLHHCDNRACINPDHLFLGTQDDNVQDMISKGRDNFTARAKLSAEQVAQIRELIVEERLSLSAIGRMFDVTIQSIFAIKYGINHR